MRKKISDITDISLGYKDGGKLPEMNAMNRSEKTYMGGGKFYNKMYEKGAKVKK